MKVGETVCLKYPFKLVTYSIEEQYLLLDVIEREDIYERLTIPMCIGALGIKTFGASYITPGDHLPITHADYYERSGDRVVVASKLYELRLDTHFKYTGIYYLVNGYEVLTKTAQKQTLDEIERMLEGSLDMVLEGKLLGGLVMRIIGRSATDIKFVKYVSDLANMSMLNYTHAAIIQDPISYVEYEVPVKLLISVWT